MRMGGFSMRLFRLVKGICGDEFLKNLVIATNMWSLVNPKEGETREQDIRAERFFKTALDNGANLLRHDNTRESAHRILRTIFKNHWMPLKIQRELVEDQSQLEDTTAGKELLSQMNTEVGHLENEPRKIPAKEERIPRCSKTD
jgi:hypothetical protein